MPLCGEHACADMAAKRGDGGRRPDLERAYYRAVVPGVRSGLIDRGGGAVTLGDGVPLLTSLEELTAPSSVTQIGHVREA